MNIQITNGENYQTPREQAQIQCSLVTAIMSLMVPSFKVEFEDDGVDRTIFIGGESYRVARDAQSLSKGTLFQTPSAIGIPPKTIEFAIQDAVEATLKESFYLRGVNAKSLASTITRILVDGVWHQKDDVDDVEALARAMRKQPASSRADISRMAAKAFHINKAEGIKRLTQVINAAPIAHRIIEEDRLIADAIAGKNPIEMVTSAGGSKILAKLARNALALIDKDNVRDAAQALSAVRSPDLIPTGRGQREWLSKLLRVVAHDEPAGGFFDWLADQTAWHQVQGDFAAARPAYFALADWAEATAGQGKGWSDRKSLAASFTSATEWSERERKKAIAKAASMEGFPVHFRQYDEDNLFVSQIGSTPQMIEVGDALHNCLATQPATFSRRALTGQAVYVVIRNARVIGDKLIPGAPRSAAEIMLHEDGPKLRQHYGRRNSAPSERDRQVIENLIKKIGGNK